jgi:dihydrolipoamide dehydrogenase
MAEIRIPDLGDFDEVEVVEIHVAQGDSIQEGDPVLTLETEKAAMDVPSTVSGVVENVVVGIGDKVSDGDLVGNVSSQSVQNPEIPIKSRDDEAEQNEFRNETDQPMSSEDDYDLVVLGAGPGGYAAAFRASDLGLKVALVDRNADLGGVCLNVGCIPSKAFLHAAKILDDSKEAEISGIKFNEPEINLSKMKTWKNNIIGGLTGGLKGLAKKRNVEVIQGTATFLSKREIEIIHDGKSQKASSKQFIVAVGSEPAELPFLPDDPRIIDSTGALEPNEIPSNILIIGGGIIGLEMSTIYSALGSEVTIVELTKDLMPGTDPDLVRPLEKVLKKKCKSIMKSTQVISAEPSDQGIRVTFMQDGKEFIETFQNILVAVGRKSNGNLLGLDAIGVNIDERGIINVDKQFRTNVESIFAIGDVIGDPMLAHKASHEGKIAAEVVSGHKVTNDVRCIPSVAYTDPEVAWVGLSEEECKAKGFDYGKGIFPWSASGRSLTIGRNEGMTKLLFNKSTKKIIGGGIVGPNAGDLIAEIALAIEMDCDVNDIALTVHPHPTLSETVAMAAEVFEGTITDLYIKSS